ncbi:cytochrome oxidase assembly protein ShyY1 [Bradyrhizobium sp. USDA 4451]
MTVRSARPPLVLLTLGMLGVVLLSALGVWQIERRTWKLALIERVEQRMHAAAVAPPPPSSWPAVTAASDEYRRVTVRGTFLNADETLVQAVTAEGPGFWVLTPLQMADGTTVLVNRGFVPPEKRDPATRRDGAPQGPGQCHRVVADFGAEGRFPAQQRPCGGPLVFARRRRDRRRARIVARRPLFHRCRCDAESRRQPPRRAHDRAVSQQPPNLRADMVCAGLYAGGRAPAHRRQEPRRRLRSRVEFKTRRRAPLGRRSPQPVSRPRPRCSSAHRIRMRKMPRPARL